MTRTHSYQPQWMKSETNTRQSFTYLRSVCRDFAERLTLGDAIRNGWTALAISELTARYKSDGGRRCTNESAHRQAISKAASQRFITEEERAAWRAETEAIQTAIAERRAIKATKDNRPKLPAEFKPFLAACQTMMDCDNLVTTVERGWSASDLTTIAMGWRRNAKGQPTPSALRLAVATAGVTPGEHMFLK